MIESLDNALVRAAEMLKNPHQLRRVVISGKRRNYNPPLLRIDVRPVEIKGAIHFQLVGHDGRQDTTRNLLPHELSLTDLMNDGFGNLLVETMDEELNIRITKSGEAQVSIRKIAPVTILESATSTTDFSHDRKKERFLEASEPIFQALGISDHLGKLKPSRSEKFIQVNEFLKIIDQLPQLSSKSISMVDLGCGNAYLTFAAHQFISKKGSQPHTIGVDSRESSRKRNIDITKSIGKDKEIEFHASEISDFPHREVDLTLALHACDTASDDALAWAIKSKSKVILVAPCCHHDIQSQMKSRTFEIPEAWNSVLRHGILRERVSRYRELKKYEEALEAFYEARKYFKTAREVIHVARCDQKIAHCYTELGDAESALAAAQKAVDVFTTAHDHRRLTYASFELGKAQVLSGDVDEGLNTLERVLDIAADAESKDFPFIIAIERRIAEILHTQGRSEEAIEIERRIASISEILED